MNEEKPKIYRDPGAWLKYQRGRPVVSVLRLEGVIATGRGGPLRPGSLNLAALNSQIEQAFKPKRLSAVALQINSPGGSPVQSALIADAVRRKAVKKGVPVLAFAEDVAASGGYWLMTAGDELYVHPASIVGSIGVIYAFFGFQELMQRHGVERRIHTAGERKVMLDPFSPEREEDVERLGRMQEQIHQQFIDQVKARRSDKLNRRRYKEIFSGDVFVGEEAVRLGLVDGLGVMDQVLREKFGEHLILKRISVKSSPLRRLLGGARRDIAADALASIDDRLAWNRFGL
ncbi:S49 family peptidase [Minwuia thermotolerans]|uniref:S49 family peptidase n=1 Tax=Minwuia thermotolerans TaxID=2056226 RepID=A0A2M9FX31_9PROT|nr:S49 family peptidase [Minwuia thermotolerans]PJK28025.1 S49 family peptidase [Minwuia thermotolerans]